MKNKIELNHVYNIFFEKLDKQKKLTNEQLTKQLIGNAAKLESLKNYLGKYHQTETTLALAKKLWGDDFVFNEEQQQPDLYKTFENLNQQYKYFENIKEDSKEYQDYLECYQICHYFAEVIEQNNHGDEVASRAYNMLVLFGLDANQTNTNIFRKVDSRQVNNEERKY